MKSSGDWRSLLIATRQELARKNPDSLLDYAQGYRLMGDEPMRIIPALQDIYKDTHPFLVIQKAAQVFITEYLITLALWIADTGQGGRGGALYVMPTQRDVEDLSQSRLDKAISDSEYLLSRLKQPRRSGPDRIRLKRIGRGYIFLRGSEATRGLSSIPADVVVLDEYDLMAEGVLELAQKRLGSSQLGWLRVASTPTLPEAGINSLFLQSDQQYYFMKCPGCGLDQRLTWDDNVDQKQYKLVCRSRKCRHPIDLWLPGHWEAAAPANDQIRGYHLSRLYSPLANIRQMVFESQATTPAARQLFSNAVLGETFVPPGGQLTLDILDRCRRDYRVEEVTR